MTKVAGRTTRALELSEYKKIIELAKNGFEYIPRGKRKEHIFRSNQKLSLALQLEANLGLRVSDILKLSVADFKKDRLEIRETKTNKLQYKKVNKDIKKLVLDFAKDMKLKDEDILIDTTKNNIQKRLKIITDYLKLDNVCTHSFRKMYATQIYKNTKDIELVSELLNHSSVSITQRYIKIHQDEIDEISESINFN